MEHQLFPHEIGKYLFKVFLETEQKEIFFQTKEWFNWASKWSHDLLNTKEWFH